MTMSKFVFIPKKWVLLELDYNLFAQAEFMGDHGQFNRFCLGGPGSWSEFY